MFRKMIPLISAALLAFSFAAGAQDMPAKAAADGTLTDAKGMTLYTFDRDAGGKSACNGPCATNWPPLMAAADAKAAGDWTVITRDDGASSGRTRASRCTRGRRTRSRATRPATTSTTCGIQPPSSALAPRPARGDARRPARGSACAGSSPSALDRTAPAMSTSSPADPPLPQPDLLAAIPRLRRYARVLTGDPSRADDLVQEALARAWEKRRLWRAGSDLRAWLFTVMHNVFVNQRALARREAANVSLDAEGEGNAAWQMPVRANQHDARRAAGADAARRPPAGGPARGAAARRGRGDCATRRSPPCSAIPVGTVMSRLSRAREKLRRMASRSRRRRCRSSNESSNVRREPADEPAADHRRRRQRLRGRPARARAHARRSRRRSRAIRRSRARRGTARAERRAARRVRPVARRARSRALLVAARASGTRPRARGAPAARWRVGARRGGLARRRRGRRLVRPRRERSSATARRRRSRGRRRSRTRCTPPTRSVRSRVWAAEEKRLVTWLSKRLGLRGARARSQRRSATRWSAGASSPATSARRRCSCTRTPTSSG